LESIVLSCVEYTEDVLISTEGIGPVSIGANRVSNLGKGATLGGILDLIVRDGGTGWRDHEESVSIDDYGSLTLNGWTSGTDRCSFISSISSTHRYVSVVVTAQYVHQIGRILSGSEEGKGILSRSSGEESEDR
jgi:hypothetical protein